MMSDSHPVDWLVLSRYGFMVSVAELIPIPFVDAGVQNLLRKRMVRRIAKDHGLELSEEDVTTLGPREGGGCMGCLTYLFFWPIRKIFKNILFLLTAKTMADLFSDTVHRGLLLHEAIERGWLPGDAGRVRLAMDTSIEKIDIRVVERALLGTYRDHRNELNSVIFETTELLRKDSPEARADELADVVDGDKLPTRGTEMSAALAASLRGLGTAPELIQWFVAEMEAEPTPAPAPEEKADA